MYKKKYQCNKFTEKRRNLQYQTSINDLKLQNTTNYHHCSKTKITSSASLDRQKPRTKKQMRRKHVWLCKIWKLSDWIQLYLPMSLFCLYKSATSNRLQNENTKFRFQIFRLVFFFIFILQQKPFKLTIDQNKCWEKAILWFHQISSINNILQWSSGWWWEEERLAPIQKCKNLYTLPVRHFDVLIVNLSCQWHSIW